MTNFQALVMGIVQGLTEYLPVSSSAHLVLVPKFLDWNFSTKTAFIFDILVQLGTLVGVIIYFRKDLICVARSFTKGILCGKILIDQHAKIGWLVILASIPAFIVGVLFKSNFEAYFSSPFLSCVFLIFTGILLFLAELVAKISKKIPSKKDAFLIGCAQSLALFPGISRSGSTIAAGMTLGLSRQSAARFSFFMSIPIMLGASIVAMDDLVRDSLLVEKMGSSLLVGCVSAALSGYLVIYWFMKFLSKKPLHLFASYCFLLGIFGVLYFS